jgi:hypothetical protein
MLFMDQAFADRLTAGTRKQLSSSLHARGASLRDVLVAGSLSAKASEKHEGSVPRVLSLVNKLWFSYLEKRCRSI